MSCLDMEMKVLQFFRQGALLHSGKVIAGVVGGEARHGELKVGVHVLVLTSLHGDA